MRKFFTFFAAALMSVGMFGATVQENKSLDASEWWGWNSTQANVESKLEGTITGAYGAIGTSFENADWSGWNKLVVVVDNIEGCEGEWWFLKAELRDNSFDPNASANVTMSGELGIGHNPHETNYVVIEFASVPAGFDITNVSQLVLQSAETGSFTVSRIFLEKGTAQEPVTEDITLNASAWWGWDSSRKNVDGKLAGTITGAYGAIATNLDNADWSGWNKLVVVVDNIEGCVGEYWYLKAELRDNSFDPNASENVTMSGELGIEGHDPHETNYVVIDFSSVPAGFNLTNLSALVLQSEATGSFTVSRIFLEKEVPDPEPEPEPTPEPQMVTEDITLNASEWWGWDSSKENVEDKLAGTITGAYGAIAISFGNADWSGWNKLVVVVDNIEGCEGQYWYLKAEIRNPGYEYPTSVTMSGELGKEGHNPHETNYVVIDLTAVPEGFDITNVDALVLQSAVTGSFTVSRIFLEKPAPAPVTDPITPYADPQDAGVYYSTFFDSSVKYELPAGVEAYVADLSGANLLLTKIAEAGEVIPANVAVILKSTVTPFTLTVSDAEAVTFTATNDLQGSDTQIATPANCYVLAGTNGVGFYHYTAANLNPHKAYVVYSGTPNLAPHRMPFVFDQATGVENVQNSDIRSQKVVENGQLIIIKNGVKYNAQGQIVK